MEKKNYIFCALDFTNLEESINFTNKIKNHIGGIKLGLSFYKKWTEWCRKNKKKLVCLFF